MFFLRLNDMRDNRVELLTIVCIGENKEEFEELLKREAVPTYPDVITSANPEFPTGYRYMKSFRKGGPLEWYNPPKPLERYMEEIPSREEILQAGGEDRLRHYDYLTRNNRLARNL